MRGRRIWRLTKHNSDAVQTLTKGLGISPTLAKILVNRGITSLAEAEGFLRDDVRKLKSPFEMKGIKEGAERVHKAMASGEKILVYGDYDVDGITSTALLTGLLRRLGAQVDYYIPARMEEGYGLNNQAILQAKEQGVDLLISVDCGISSVQEAEYAASLGLDIIITDHHQPPARLPQACAVINPKLMECQVPWLDLAGVGVAYKLGQSVAQMQGKGEYAYHYLDLVALGTIADIVPLTGENRILVKEGLKLLAKAERPGIKALLEVTGLYGKEISTGQVGFGLAPRLNACGRLSDANLGVELLLTDSYERAREVALFLDKENQMRQVIEAEILQDAVTRIEKELDLAQEKIIVLASAEWHPGVIGIVASRLTEKYYRPTVLISLDKGVGKGSARSIPGFNLYQALVSLKGHLLKYGGHEMAAGLTIAEEAIPSFRRAINEYAAQTLTEKDMIPFIQVDAEIAWEEINEDLIQEITWLAPFGLHNPSPVLALRRGQMCECKEVGTEGAHLKVRVLGENRRLDGIGFQLGTLATQAAAWDRCDLAFVPEINVWNGRSQVQLNIKDIKPSHEPDDPFQPISFLDQLYLEGEVWLEDDYYRDITNREEFYTKVVGVTFNGRQEIIRQINEGETVILQREPHNIFDPWAIAVYYNDAQIGYLNARLSRNLAQSLDKGARYQAYVTQVTGRLKEILGVNLCIRRVYEEETTKDLGKIKEKFRALPAEEMWQEIRKAILGEFDYHPKQKEALQALRDGRNSLVIFGTGRGKSAVFQTMAAYLALAKGKATVIVYPLRSLVNDQYHRLKDKLAPLGVSVAAINGSLNLEERKEFFKGVHQGNIDVILTTPEFLAYHLEKFHIMVDRIGLFVVDEAHHLQGKRYGYRQLGKVWRELGAPLALAVTATANDETAQHIVDTLACRSLIIDTHERANLQVLDRRGERDKLKYLLNLIACGERVVIYVNSRKQAYQLAKELRQYYPSLRDEIGFYHGGLNSEYRLTLENMFREGTLRVMVTTSAFGEGVDFPDIRHVVLYHLSFSRTEFNQLSGRAGRDNGKAQIHLLFGEGDRKLNELILEGSTPSREVLGKLYLYLRDKSRTLNPLQITNSELAEYMQQAGHKNFREQTASASLAILEELGLLLREVEGNQRYLHLAPPPPGKLDLSDSVRYLEGLEEWEEFKEFAEYVLKEDAGRILGTVNKPIFPQRPLNLKED
ncbi:MAG: single-stranded-DNA-specific exonuclease RecJ [Peptococcaceae bacterium]|jgi:single-stranded-DNA-specific exonuclease|nr:single-stranded-DNA-specific exonuclease RecJ [Peptococcaceae bacterium]